MPERHISPDNWGHATVQTACPLDCPDSCSLDVTIEKGRVIEIDGSHVNPATGGYICAKVRRFTERLYHAERLLHPMVRKGPKGSGTFSRIGWDEALDRVASQMLEVKERWGGEAILPFSYGGSNGIVSQDTNDAELFRGFGTSRLLRSVCAAPTTAAATALYGKMGGVAYQDYEHAALIVVWGANPSASGIHIVPYIRAAQKRGATLVVIDPRSTPLARLADLHVPVRPGTDLVIALALHRHLFENGFADEPFLARHAHGVAQLRERARDWTFDRAAETAGVPVSALEQLADLYVRSSPAVIRCGWGLERNRNGGSAAAAILALPAVAGKFGVRGGGYTMSNSAAYGLRAAQWIDTPEPSTRIVNMNHLGRALLDYDDPPVKMLFVYDCNPAVTMPEQTRVIRGLEREDLFTVVFDQIMTDTARYADVLLPATTFLEQYDVAKGYGAYNLQLVRPVVEPAGEAKPNTEVFGALMRRLGLREGDEDETEAEALLRITSRLPDAMRAELMDAGAAMPPLGRTPVQFVDAFPLTPDQKIDLFPEAVAADAPAGLYGYQPDPATPEFPLALISPATGKTISSTLGETLGAAFLEIHPDDAAERKIGDGDAVRVFNQRGTVECRAKITGEMRPGTVSLPKGLWRKSTTNGFTANALAPDTLSDLGGGACFNDARVQVAKA